jgi:hypothetical protein
MHLVCLCPTYGRPSLPANALALFKAQVLRPFDTADLVIFDDAGQIDEQFEIDPPNRKRWVVFSRNAWQPLPTKYPDMVRLHAAWSMPPDPDVYVIWDDDDVYLPWHLAAHAESIAAGADWSHPSAVWSTYGRNPLIERPRPEAAAGRFHGAAAVTPACLALSGGWCADDRADYDQEHLRRWAAAGRRGDPCRTWPPSYVYRWADTQRNHCSGSIQHNRYKRPPIQEPGHVSLVTPVYDASTAAILARLAK